MAEPAAGANRLEDKAKSQRNIQLQTNCEESMVKTFSRRWTLFFVLALLVLLAVRYLDHFVLQATIKSGRVQLQAKEYTEAIKTFSRAINIAPKDADAYHGRAMVYLKLRKSDLALADLDEALRLVPGDPKVIYNRGIAYFQKADYNQALTEFSEAIRLDPKWALAFLGRSRTHAKMGKHELATADRQKATELDSSLETPKDEIP